MLMLQKRYLAFIRHWDEMKLNALYLNRVYIFRMVDPIIPNNRIESTRGMGDAMQNDQALVLLLCIYTDC